MFSAEAPPDLSRLAALSRSELLSDRAYANGVLRLRYLRFPLEREQTRAAYEASRAFARQLHAATALRGPALRHALDQHPLEHRDYWIEELLDIAHPPLDEPRLPPNHTPYIASGATEILHALDATRLGPEDTFVDVGAGLGKVVMLASLLTGARCHAVELDPALVEQGRAAAASLGLDRVTFIEGDARLADLGAGTVYYLFSPFEGPVLDPVMARLQARSLERQIFVCSSPARQPWLAPASAPCSWLVVHRSLPSPRPSPP